MQQSFPKGFWYDSIDSTMDEAKRLIYSGQIQDIAFVVANHQTNGRGTHGRKWESPKDSGIYLSVIHLPKENKYFETTTIYTLACGIACIEALKEVCNINAQLKPVNDIYVDEKKLGGILVESKLQHSGISCLITGVGINTHKVDRDLDRPDIEPVSLEEILRENDFSDFIKKDLIKKIVGKICSWYIHLFNGNKKLIQTTWEKYCLHT